MIGSEAVPHLNKLEIVLYGTLYGDRQLPMFGNKVLGCHEC